MDQESSITWGFTRKAESQALIPDLVSQDLPFNKTRGALFIHLSARELL